jgi:hypothetical protein
MHSSEAIENKPGQDFWKHLANRRLQPLGHLSGFTINNKQSTDCLLSNIHCVCNIYTLLSMDIAELLRRNWTRCKQVGQIIETRTAFFGRYYASDTCDNSAFHQFAFTFLR